MDEVLVNRQVTLNNPQHQGTKVTIVRKIVIIPRDRGFQIEHVNSNCTARSHNQQIDYLYY